MKTPFDSVLIANRGEIAVRIARACREAGLRSVAVYSEADATAPHVRAADAAVPIGPAPSTESYLRIDALVDAARKSGAQAVHPGYGFLAENAEFAAAVERAGLVWIGPPPEAIARMGDKTAARSLAERSGVPVVPAVEELPAHPDEAVRAVRPLGYPVLVKAAAGGGGKGMRVVRNEAELPEALAGARREAESAFGDDRLFVEKYLPRPRHVEVQILADDRGTTIHLGERECSIQRRHQKIVEESPSPGVDTRLRARLVEAAISIARAVGYRNAGTVEFLVDERGEFYFLEMNTRLQVEHPVTELVAGIDLVQAQFAIASGEPLPFRQKDVVFRGHAMECRIYAEDPTRDFLPSPGRVLWLREPQGPGVRLDSGIEEDYEVPPHYDALLSKLCTWGADRETARKRMERALDEYAILGFPTCLPLLRDLVRHPAFASGKTHTHFLEEHFSGWTPRERYLEIALVAAALEAAKKAAPAREGLVRQEAPSPWVTLGRWRLGEGSRT
ncbi:MAG: hypothetical protein KatS3mg076_0260 [Candidatus Binatia bacterium]|nr:MAG: hypothetical protein KatS3mg076_0260 [Candidatus Binatia bacterium]